MTHRIRLRLALEHVGAPGSRVTRLRPGLLGPLLACLFSAAACSGGKSTPSQTAPPVSSISSPPTTPTTSSSPTPAPSVAREDADRRAVETAWLGYWATYDTILDTPQKGWSGAISKIAVNPIYGKLLKQDRAFAAAGITGYGRVIAHPIGHNRSRGGRRRH